MTAKKRKQPARRLKAGTTLAIVEAGMNTRFQPGQSGNPKGRPSYSALSAAYRHQLGCQLDAETARALKLSPDATVAEAIAVVLSRCALAGDVQAARELCNRVEGQAPAFLGVAFGAPHPKTEVTIRVVEDPPLSPRNRKKEVLYVELVRLIETSNDEAEIDAAANLAQTLRVKIGANARG